jgi:hypothetical protein
VLLRLAYLSLTNTFALLHLIPMSNQDKDIEILPLRHQIAVLQRKLGATKVRFSPTDRALLAALLRRLPRHILHRLACWHARTQSCAGTATCSADATPECPDRDTRADRAPSARHARGGNEGG